MKCNKEQLIRFWEWFRSQTRIFFKDSFLLVDKDFASIGYNSTDNWLKKTKWHCGRCYNSALFVPDYVDILDHHQTQNVQKAILGGLCGLLEVFSGDWPMVWRRSALSALSFYWVHDVMSSGCRWLWEVFCFWFNFAFMLFLYYCISTKAAFIVLLKCMFLKQI